MESYCLLKLILNNAEWVYFFISFQPASKLFHLFLYIRKYISLFFCIFSNDQRLTRSLMHLCSLHFFISFHDNVWPDAQRDCFIAALIRWKSKLICQVMFNQVITGSSIREQNGLRWLTRQLKPLCRDLGSRPRVGRLFPSTGLQESSIMRNFILFFNVG